MKSVTRRNFLKLSGTTLIGMTLGGVALRANAQEKITEDDATAKALQYVSKTPKEGSVCANCMYVAGEVQGDYVPCTIFQGKLVNKNGWCSAWVKKPG